MSKTVDHSLRCDCSNYDPMNKAPTYIRHFRLHPGVVGRGAGAAGAGTARPGAPLDEQRARGAYFMPVGISTRVPFLSTATDPAPEELLPLLMQVLQQMAPMNGAAGPGAAAAPAAPLDEALLRQEKMRQHLQQAAAAQSAV